MEAIDRPMLYREIPRDFATSFLQCNTEPTRIIHWRTFITALLYSRGRKIVPLEKETVMSWKTPKIVEVPVGMEINMYACAARK
jgi:coenzyme PQQ precursor peptide PqqA